MIQMEVGFIELEQDDLGMKECGRLDLPRVEAPFSKFENGCIYLFSIPTSESTSGVAVLSSTVAMDESRIVFGVMSWVRSW